MRPTRRVQRGRPTSRAGSFSMVHSSREKKSAVQRRACHKSISSHKDVADTVSLTEFHRSPGRKGKTLQVTLQVDLVVLHEASSPNAETMLLPDDVIGHLPPFLPLFQSLRK